MVSLLGRRMTDPEHLRDSILFVSATGGLGGPSRTLATVLAHADSGYRRVLAAPQGGFVDLVRSRRLCEEHVAVPKGGRFPHLSLVRASLRIAMWSWRRRGRLAAIFANGSAELNLAGLAAILGGVPIVVWAHASTPSAWSRRLAPVWRRLLRQVRWVAVSETASRVLVDLGLCGADEVTIVPNMVDPSDVRAGSRRTSDTLTIGYIAPATPQKGFHLLPGIAALLSDAPVRWAIFVPASSVAQVREMATLKRLSSASQGRVLVRPWVQDVREVYAQIDVLLCPSFRESFSRIAAEAMVNGLPVVASDLVELRELLGDDEAGLLFPAGDEDAAAHALMRLVSDPSLRASLGDRGRAKAQSFRPEAVMPQLVSAEPSLRR